MNEWLENCKNVEIVKKCYYFITMKKENVITRSKELILYCPDYFVFHILQNYINELYIIFQSLLLLLIIRIKKFIFLYNKINKNLRK